MEEGEELQYDPSAYVMLHQLNAEWPCLTFDVIRDNLGGNRTRFPLTMFAAVGTQADRAENNKLTLMKLTDLHRLPKTKEDGGDEETEINLDQDEEDEVRVCARVRVCVSEYVCGCGGDRDQSRPGRGGPGARV